MKEMSIILVTVIMFTVGCASTPADSSGLVCRIESEQTAVVRGHPYTVRTFFKNNSTNSFAVFFDWDHRSSVSLDFVAIPSEGEAVVLDQKDLCTLQRLSHPWHLEPMSVVSGRYAVSTYQLAPGDYEFCIRYVSRTNSVEWFMGIGEHFHPGGTIDDVWMGQLESNKLKLKITDKREERPTTPFSLPRKRGG